MLTSPPAVIARSTEAKAVWFANVSATATPTAAEPLDVVSPLAVVFAVAVVVALSATSPKSVWAGPGCAHALDVTLSMETATAGAIATPPDAPVRASVVDVFVALAVSVRSVPPVTAAPRPIAALVVTFTMLSATDAPRPKLEPPAPAVPGSAFESELELDVALRVALPAPIVTAAAGPMSALVEILPITRANEPASPTDPPPAPLDRKS